MLKDVRSNERGEAYDEHAAGVFSIAIAIVKYTIPEVAAARWLASLYGTSRGRRLAIGVVVAAAGALCRLIFPDSLGDRLSYVTFYPAVQIAALVGGLVSGLTAVVLTALLAHLLFVPISNSNDWLGLTIFLISGVIVSGVAEALRSELARGKGRLEAVIEATTDAVITINEAGIIQSMNLAGVQMFNYQPEEIVGRNVRLLMPECDCSRHVGHLQDCLRTGKAQVSSVGFQIEGRRKDASLFPIEVAFAEARHKGARLFVGCARDLSEQREAEARIEKLHTERLKAVEAIAAALAHELNQPLTAMVNYLEVMSRMVRARPELQSANLVNILSKTIRETVRAGEIIRNLRAFITGSEPDKTIQSLHEVIEEAYETAFKDRNPSILGALELKAADDKVLVDRVQIRLVLVNLLRNAMEAMSGCEKRALKVSTRNEQDMVRIDVADTGPGVSEQVNSGLFEAFATTKEHGMGVGLAISKSIIDAHYGKIWVEPNPGGGAVFSLALPLLAKERAELRARKESLDVTP